jgi:hypothetical protein
MIYFMGMSHVLPVLKACSAGGLEQQIGRIHNDLPPAFVDWDLTPGALPEQLRVANLYIRQIAPQWGATLAVQSATTVVGLVPGFQELLSSITNDPGQHTLFAFIHGEEHIHLSLRDREDPLDFCWPERPDLVVLPKRQVIPLEIIDKQVKAQLTKTSGILMAIRATHPELRIINVVCPPTIRSFAFDSGNGVAETDMVLAPLSVRLKYYLAYQRQLCQTAVSFGIENLLPPQECVSADGYLMDEFAGDSVHGNARYGHAVLQQMNALL